MSRIQKIHIRDYIGYLYKRKYKKSAPEDLLVRWSKLPAYSIDAELKKLYEYWSLTNYQIFSLETEFYVEFNNNEIPIEQIIGIIAIGALVAIILFLLILKFT